MNDETALIVGTEYTEGPNRYAGDSEVLTLLSDHVEPCGGVAVTRRSGMIAVYPLRNLVPVPVKQVFPERWINVYDHFISPNYLARTLADRGAMTSHGRIGVLHMFPDGTTEMEPA
jgi:hypothetical protein